MKNKRVFKIILDSVMLVLLVLMFKKNAISMSFHEIGGLALIGLFIIHNLVNGKWIKAVFGRFFNGINGRTRMAAIVNLMLAAVFILIGVSGVLMTHGVSGSWKTVHYFCAAVSIVLMGVHLGLHLEFIKNAFGKLRNKKSAKAVGSLFLIAALAYGVYGIESTSFTHWLTMPFSSGAEIGNMEGRELNQQTQTSENSGEGNNLDSISSATTSESNSANGNGRGLGDGMHQNGGEISASNIFSTISSYLSIIILFAFITASISDLIQRRKRKSNTNKSEDYITGECREL